MMRKMGLYLGLYKLYLETEKLLFYIYIGIQLDVTLFGYFI
jgi:hypothetical protein